jgi:hypothetical protein
VSDPFVAGAYILGVGTIVAYVLSLRLRRAQAAQRQVLLEREALRDRLGHEAL